MTCRTPPFWSCGESSSWSSWPASPCTGGFASSSSGPREMEALGWWGVPLAVLGGAIRASTPFLFVSLGECLTEKSGRINLGLEGTLVMGAMSGYGIAYLTGWPWLGVVVAGSSGMALGALHGVVCSRPRVNDIAVGIALMLFGLGLAFYLGKPFIQPKAPRLPAIDLGWWSSSPQVRAALVIFARWDPVLCFFAALLFGGAGALGPALQSVGITWGYYLFNAAPYVLTLLIMIATSSTRRTLIGAPGELSVTK